MIKSTSNKYERYLREYIRTSSNASKFREGSPPCLILFAAQRNRWLWSPGSCLSWPVTGSISGTYSEKVHSSFFPIINGCSKFECGNNWTKFVQQRFLLVMPKWIWAVPSWNKLAMHKGHRIFQWHSFITMSEVMSLGNSIVGYICVWESCQWLSIWIN